ncbi:MAG: hypothetical protein ACR2OU_15570 [Thermomicrobiales bacterium]
MVSFLNSHVSSISRMPATQWGEIRTRLPAFVHKARRHILLDPLLFLWQLLTAPLWLGSGIPMPGYPAIRPTAIESKLNSSIDDFTSPVHYLDEQIQALGRRFWLAGIFAAAFRGFTIAAIACTIWAIGGLGKFTSNPNLRELLALALIGALVGAAFGFVIRPSAMRIASMLDRTFQLDERLTTAFDPTLTAITPGPMRRLQLADAANGFAEIRGDVRGAAVLPVREAVIAVLAAICLVTALLFSISGNQIPATSNAVVPAFVPSSERFVREQQELESQKQAEQRAALAQTTKPSANTDEQGKATKDLSTVGTALKDQPLTKSASNSISSGDYSAASKSLRDSAAAAKDLPQDQRNALAKNLDDAASTISPANKDLADASKQAATDLRAGGDQATKGLNDLADQIDKTGEKATPNKEAGAAQPATSDTGSSSSSNQTSSSSSQSQAQQSQASQQGGNTQSKQPASSTTSDPGSGMAAQPGIGSEPEQNPAGQSASQQKSGNASGSGQSSQAQPGAGAGPQQAGQQSGASAGQSSSSANNSAGNPAQSQGSDSNSSPGTSSDPSSGKASSQQAGTGGGAGQTNATNPGSPGQDNSGAGTSANKPAGPSDTAGNGKAGNPPPGNDNPGSNTGNPPSAQSGNQSLVLQGTSGDNSVSTGNDVGSSSSGSGGGSGAASGSATQGKVGPTGPDSNHVPDAYRDIVKGYFDGDGTTP